ncbi:type 1 glutamine amidotransferase domain-containing protein [Actinacidiphila rubida]|uniref:Putative intracellular protease/amidase n=1 Tax=Actinacidiphila rubida TaxID=310780 RepID=A0A1H8QLU9_9ACTN|nr:type 1 glutamine amidotransferase domain-containing protein [Actinacidiphila rubida]SEO55209.1 Putative intracellular protease/amidase [Actinacidiphila rubida]
MRGWQQLGSTGQRSGYTVMEAADPWSVLTEAGWSVEFTTVQGGPPPEDGFDQAPMPLVPAFRADEGVQHKLEHAPKPEDVDPDSFDLVFYVGGHGAMWDFPRNADLERIGARVYENGGIVAAVCHGPAVFVNLRLSDGTPLVAGKNMTGFSNLEERTIHRETIVPFLLQTTLEGLGAHYSSAGFMEPHVVSDDRLVTGQNPVSALGVARAAVSHYENPR